MVRFKWFIYLITVGLLCVEIRPANAQIPRVKDLPRAATSIQEWLTQASPVAEIVRITRVRLNPTQGGLEIILETADGKLLQGSTSVQNDRLIVEVSKAQLQLFDGQTFRRENPIAGIAAVEVSASTDNTVQVTVTGVDGLPKGTVVQAQSGLVLSVTPVAESPEEEVVVTAQKTPQNPQNVPISLTVLQRQELEDANVRSIRGIAVNTPNFFSRSGDRTFGFQTIRGLGNSNFLTRDAISFYLDDVPYEYLHQFLPGELFDLERVEILRGPQGTLYGRGSQAGVINIVSRPPTNFPEIRIGGGYGNFNQRRVQLSLSDAIVPDRFAFRLAGAYNARDGFTKDTNLQEDANAQSSLAGRLNLLWTPDKAWSISFNTNAAANRDGDQTFVPINQANPFTRARNVPGRSDSSINTQALKVAYEGSSFRFTSISARNYSEISYLNDVDNSLRDLQRGVFAVDSTIWSQELRLQSPKTADRFQWLLGGYLQSRSFNIDPSATETTPFGATVLRLPAGTSETTANFDQTTYAIFGQIEFKPIEPLTLTTGLRYEKNRSELDRDRIFIRPDGTILSQSLLPRKSEVEDDVVLPKFAATYRLSPNLAVYGSIARGAKPSTQNFRAADPILLALSPERSWSYEVGAKSSWFENRLTASFAAYWTNVSDYQVLIASQNRLFQDIANAEVKTNGIELELRARPIESVELIAGIGTTNARFTNYTNPLSRENLTGNKLTYAPEYTYNLAVQYRRNSIFGRVELQGYGTTFFNDTNTLQQDPYLLVNARVGYEWKKYAIYFYVNNLFDKRYLNGAFLGAEPLATFGDRRLFGFQIQATF
ncbi:TonB-dependent receptor domain-containing protein [Phormidesmis sp. 146-35]